MGGLLRKKHKSEQQKKTGIVGQQQQQRMVTTTTTAGATGTPVFAKFGTTGTEAPRMVSSPMALGKGGAGHGKGSSSGGGGGGEKGAEGGGEGEYADLWKMIVAPDSGGTPVSQRQRQTEASDRALGTRTWQKAKNGGGAPRKPLIFAAMAAVDHNRQQEPQPQPPPPPKAKCDKSLPPPPDLGVPLDKDPFAKAEGVKMLSPPSVSASRPPSRGDKAPSESTSSSANIRSNASSTAASPMTSDDDDMPRAPAIHPPPVVPARTDDPDRLTQFLSDAKLLRSLVALFAFYDWCLILSLSREIRFMVVQNLALRETVLERFLSPVGYRRWSDPAGDPLSLSLQDLSDYMRAVSTPTHEYARIAALHNHALYVHPAHRDPALHDTVKLLAAACRAYSRVVLRLRAQAERDARPPPHTRPPSPSSSPPPRTPFQSPLFRLKRAPLLRVFVPSPDGDWLSDKSVLECEAECRRAGVMGLLRLGDVVWDVAVGDEGNVGRLVWDGSYLIDLDYTYSPIGDLPKYMPTLAFPPSYFHRVIRTGAPGSPSANPVAHVDLRPWGDQVAANLQLLQDRVRTETPQGTHHNVVRWVHRSSFMILPPRPSSSSSPSPTPTHAPRVPRVPIPDSGLFVDPGWYGKIVVETEGTNEALADLQERCGPRAFPPRPAPAGAGAAGAPGAHGMRAVDWEARFVFRILREKSRPGEIWIRAVSPKEKLL